MYKASNGKCYYKVGLHIHTNLSDGAVSPEQMAKIYREAQQRIEEDVRKE